MLIENDILVDVFAGVEDAQAIWDVATTCRGANRAGPLMLVNYPDVDQALCWVLGDLMRQRFVFRAVGGTTDVSMIRLRQARSRSPDFTDWRKRHILSAYVQRHPCGRPMMKEDAQTFADLAVYYGQEAILDRIDAALRSLGRDPKAPTIEDLKPVDEFHTGGVEATLALLDPLGIHADMQVLDIGSGIGGTARLIASRYGATVTGVDLTPAFVAVATELSARVGLDGKTRFQIGSATVLPTPPGQADLVTMFHVGMNIADKDMLFLQVAAALKPGGRFALFDIMRGPTPEEISFPAPWSPDAAHSFVAPPQVYREAAAQAGLSLLAERDRSAFAKDFFTRVTKAIAENGVPPIGLHLLMGEEAPIRYGNAVAAAQDARSATWEMVFQKPT